MNKNNISKKQLGPKLKILQAQEEDRVKAGVRDATEDIKMNQGQKVNNNYPGEEVELQTIARPSQVELQTIARPSQVDTAPGTSRNLGEESELAPESGGETLPESTS